MSGWRSRNRAFATSSADIVKPLLSIPPFPGSRHSPFATPLTTTPSFDAHSLLDAIAKHRVGGRYWGRQPQLPATEFVLDGTSSPLPGAVLWPDDVDPWHLLENAASVRLRHGDIRGLLALAADRPLTFVDDDGAEQKGDEEVASLVALGIAGWRWRSPYDGADLSPIEAIELCGFWRQLIDANRRFDTVLGIAEWKKSTVSPLLWGGRAVPYGVPVNESRRKQVVAAWRSRLSEAQKHEISVRSLDVVEIEDGFIRSVGLGADCVPPLSIVVDPQGIHFDPCNASTLEDLLQHGEFSQDQIGRAQRLRQAIVEAGLSKYGRGRESVSRPGGTRVHVLVTGQVEDDRSVTSGLALPSNLELLRRVRAEVGPSAYLIYKPHPDVLAGHRCGDVPQAELAQLADHVEVEASMPALIEMIDELHVNTSLAGFEALMRGKPVTVYGVPFYAGWGLTVDRGAVPERRTAKRSLDELVAAALLLYPRYIDPDTGLPAPAEVLIDKLSVGSQRLNYRMMTIVAIRRALGRLRRVLPSRLLGGAFTTPSSR